MPLRVYNTYSKQLENFSPLTPGQVRMYNCGPTVYDSPHVGNFRTFSFADTLRRYLEYSGFTVRQVMNITDVGHLTRDDVEAGVDKMEEGLRRLRSQGVNVNDPYQVAEHFTREYFEARKALGFRDAHVYPRATQHVVEMVEMIQALIAKGFAYQVKGDVYFEVGKFAPYGKLSGNTLESVMQNFRIEKNEDKRHQADFALWKTDPSHLMQFDSPWGRGFPGWHIECSAMSKKHLGETLDIHTGGEDNIFPHHECEIAQSETANGRPFARYWMHARHLLWDGKKMSKSEGTFFTIKMLIDKGYPGLVIRHALVSTHYRMQVNYRMESFDDAKKNIARLNDFRRRLERDSKGATGPGDAAEIVAKQKAAFAAAMDDDLNTSGGLAALHDFVTEVNRLLDRNALSAAGAAKALDALRGFDSVFAFLEPDADVPAEVASLVQQRAAARAAKNFKESDRLRDEIKRLGWIVEDGKAGQTVKKS